MLFRSRLLVSKKVTSVISLNVKLWSDVILVVLIVMIELLIVRKKNGTTECDKSTIRSNVGIAQCNNKKILNVTEIEIDATLVLLNKTMKSSNVRKKVREPPNVRKKCSHVI